MGLTLRNTWASFKKFCKKYESVVSVLFSILPVLGNLMSKVIIKRVAVAALSLSAAGFVNMAVQEDFRKDAHIPVPGDVPTLGFGSTKDVQMGDTITVARAMVRMLDEVEDEYGAAVKRCVTTPLYQNEYDEYVNLAYNIGPGKFCGSTLAEYANEGEYGKACGQLVRFVYGPGKKPLRGLQNRRVKQYLNCVKDPNE